jgi:heptosyltransferase I
MPSNQFLQPPQSICLLRLSSLGDVCNILPLMRALQQGYPEARLSWVIGPREHKLVAGLDGVEFIVFDKSEGWAAVQGLRRQLAGRRFDVLLLAQTSARANLLSLLIKAKRRIGFDPKRAREGHGVVINERITPDPNAHQALAFLAFAHHLGVDTYDVDRRLPLPDAALAFATQHQPVAKHAVLISPASSHHGREWSVNRYAAVADWVIDKTGRPVILMGGPSHHEMALGAAIEDRMRHPVINLIGQDSLLEAVAMLERAACVISPDSGPAHMAAAMGTRVVGLYAATWARRSGPLGSLQHTVDRFPEAARQFLGSEPDQLRWGKRIERPGVMDLIAVEAVIERLKVILMDADSEADATE